MTPCDLDPVIAVTLALGVAWIAVTLHALRVLLRGWKGGGR